MAGTRALTDEEERRLLRVARKLPSRDRTLITLEWLSGFRIHEILSLTVESVYRTGQILEQIGVPPRNLKGKRGKTRWVPVLPEMEAALAEHLQALQERPDWGPTLPLFVSRQRSQGGQPRAISRMQAYEIIKATFDRAGIVDDGRLGTHSLRKTFARKVYQHSGHDIFVVQAALHHTDIVTTQKYLEAEQSAVLTAIRRGDFTRRLRSPFSTAH